MSHSSKKISKYLLTSQFTNLWLILWSRVISAIICTSSVGVYCPPCNLGQNLSLFQIYLGITSVWTLDHWSIKLCPRVCCSISLNIDVQTCYTSHMFSTNKSKLHQMDWAKYDGVHCTNTHVSPAVTYFTHDINCETPLAMYLRQEVKVLTGNWSVPHSLCVISSNEATHYISGCPEVMAPFLVRSGVFQVNDFHSELSDKSEVKAGREN